ncbi:MAG: hypothetical protein K2X87_21825 [Gemmataceae bacterium]|nr:hypothetical protein [Gemmataceae bacterium]
MPDDWRYFLLGVFGSLAVELARFAQAYKTGPLQSARYRNPVYLAVRLLLAGAGGVLAWAYHVNSDIVAIHVGASAPLLFQAMARNPADDGPAPPP